MLFFLLKTKKNNAIRPKRLINFDIMKIEVIKTDKAHQFPLISSMKKLNAFFLISTPLD